MAIIFLIFVITFFSSQTLNCEEIFGTPKIIDGDTVHIYSKKIRLEGIDAPEIKQQCKKPFIKISSVIGFQFNKSYSCGTVSKKKLINKIDNSKIKCISSSKDRYKRYLGICFLDNLDLNKWMVKNGHAVAYKKYSKKYELQEQYAKENKLGIWEGSFIEPEKWRRITN